MKKFLQRGRREGGKAHASRCGDISCDPSALEKGDRVERIFLKKEVSRKRPGGGIPQAALTYARRRLGTQKEEKIFEKGVGNLKAE